MAHNRVRARASGRFIVACVALAFLFLTRSPDSDAASKPAVSRRSLLSRHLFAADDIPGSHCDAEQLGNLTCDVLDDCFDAKHRTCKVVTHYCSEPFASGFINYVLFHYCSMHGSEFFSFVVQLFVLFVLFILLGSTADEWFVPALTTISEKLDLSANVAGVTFLALGNGAPDIASIVVAVASGAGDLAVAEPLGSGCFVTTCVMAAVTLFGPPVIVERVSFMRDILYYILSVTTVLIIVANNAIELWESLLLLALYILYVISVIITDKYYQRSDTVTGSVMVGGNDFESGASNGGFPAAQQSSLLGGDGLASGYGSVQADDGANTQNDVAAATNGGFDRPRSATEGGRSNTSGSSHQTLHSVKSQDTLLDSPRSTFLPHVGVVHKDPATGHFIRRAPEPRSRSHSTNDDVPPHQRAPLRRRSSVQIAAEAAGGAWLWAKRSVLQYLEDNDFFAEKDGEDNPDELNVFWKAMLIIEMPWTLFRNITIPQVEVRPVNRFFAVLLPTCSLLFFGISAGKGVGDDNFMGFDATVSRGPLAIGSLPTWGTLLLLGAIGSVVVFIFTAKKQVLEDGPTGCLSQLLFISGGFIMSVAWLFLLANELVDVLQSMGLIIGVPDSFLGLTVLAWGNSVGDMVSDLAVARKESPAMAVAAIYAGPMMNLLIGLGIAFLGGVIHAGGNSFDVGDQSDSFLGFVTLGVSLVSAAIVMPLSKFKSPKWFAFYLIAVYFTYTVVAVCQATHVITFQGVLTGGAR